MESLDQRYLNALQQLKEDDFTKTIIKPLFQAMGYQRVDFNGGPLERGRDLIAQIELPPRRQPLVTYIQSKKIGSIQNTTTAAKYSQLLHQLRQCYTQKLTTLDGKEVTADAIYLAVPDQVSNRFMEELASQLNFQGQEITLYDGPSIISDIKKHLPELLDSLVKIDGELLKSNHFELINTELLSALKSKKDISIKNFYSDLNFFVGSADSNSLFRLQPEIIGNKIKISSDQWEPVRSAISRIYEKHNVLICHKQVNKIEDEYKLSLKAYESKDNRKNIRDLKESTNNYQSLLTDSLKEIRSLSDLISSGLNTNSETQNNFNTSPLIAGVDPKTLEDRLSISKKLITLFENELFRNIRIPANIPKDENFYPKIKNMYERLEALKDSKTKIKKLSSKVLPAPYLHIEIDNESIINTINQGITQYQDTVRDINNGHCGPTALNKFLNQTEATLSFISMLTNLPTPLSENIILRSEKNLSDRVSVSPHDIFSTGHDIAVYGGAGVGKTTTLQAYVSLCAETEPRLIAYIPLNRIIEKYREQVDILSSTTKKQSIIQVLVLLSKKLNPTDENIEKFNQILVNPSTLILDGLDEVYNTIPFIFQGITTFKKENPNVQLIISSRDCVSYLDEIDFLGITLLPFTKYQLNTFISGWIEDKDKASGFIKAIENRDLYEHIKTPLLATIACSLVEKGIDAPSSEFEIYLERLRLLTGEYDSYKNISRQTQKGDSLRLCAKKLAFAMHTLNTRTTTKKKAYSLLRSSMSSNYSDELLKTCIDELENPCNILIKDPLTKDYSFGHFRFQEHLASLELGSNRNIDLAELTTHDWWRGSLNLYAQENDISHLFEDIYSKFTHIHKSKISLESMICNSPKNKRSELKNFLRKYEESDKLEDLILGIDDDYYGDDYKYNF